MIERISVVLPLPVASPGRFRAFSQARTNPSSMCGPFPVPWAIKAADHDASPPLAKTLAL
jgi:hypothetical protein